MKSNIDRLKVEDTISKAEKITSGEIRVHIDRKCKGDVMDRAASVFSTLNMHKTEARNGVLIYLSTENRKFAIIGDGGINEKVPDGFWQSTYDSALPYLKKGEWTEALCRAVDKCGEVLRDYFPYEEGDVNELDDGISWGDE
ncbi:MAG: hypothetical protein COA49_01625 [Bacteroidetes bacterium]|nr:MAG: hypothetical protein COA49_01625 [Bacteroidota bacterium]